MNQCNPTMKLIASTVVFTFFVTSLGITPNTFAATSVPTAEVSSLTAGTLNIPAELGQVTDTVTGDPSAPAFIHIQSAHGNYEAEKNIEKLLGYIEKNSNVRLMLLEGAANKLQPELFRLFPQNPNFNRKVTDKLMQEGYLTGPEAFLIESSNKTEGWGIENLDAYKKDREAFISVVKKEKTAEKFLGSLRATIDRRFSSKLNKDLLNLVRQEEAFGSGTVPFESWIKVLGEGSRKHLKQDLSDAFYQDQYPFLIRYFRLQAIGSKIDREKARVEEAAFLKELEKRGISKDVLGLFNTSQGNGMSSPDADASMSSPNALIGDPGLDSSLRGNDSKTVQGYSKLRFAFDNAFDKLPKDFSMNQWPNWTLYAQYIILMQEMEGKGLHEETLKLKGKILNALAKTTDEKEYLAVARQLYLLRRLFSLELTRSEYEELVRSKAYGVRSNPNAQGDAVLRTPFAVQKLYDSAMAFYQVAVVRENHMFTNALKRMSLQKQDRAVIVTGGFHAEGLKKLAASKNCSYIQITPRIAEVSKRDHEVYLKSILGTTEQVAVIPAEAGIQAMDPRLKHSGMTKNKKPAPSTILHPSSEKGAVVASRVDGEAISQMSALLGIVDRAQRVTVTGAAATKEWFQDVRGIIQPMINSEDVAVRPALTAALSRFFLVPGSARAEVRGNQTIDHSQQPIAQEVAGVSSLPSAVLAESRRSETRDEISTRFYVVAFLVAVFIGFGLGTAGFMWLFPKETFFSALVGSTPFSLFMTLGGYIGILASETVSIQEKNVEAQLTKNRAWNVSTGRRPGGEVIKKSHAEMRDSFEGLKTQFANRRMDEVFYLLRQMPQEEMRSLFALLDQKAMRGGLQKMTILERFLYVALFLTEDPELFEKMADASVYISNSGKQRLREAVQDSLFQFSDVAKVIYYEAIDKSDDIHFNEGEPLRDMPSVMLVGPYKAGDSKIGQYLAPPLGAYRIASFLKVFGFEVDVFDLDLPLNGKDESQNEREERFYEQIKKRRYSMIGFSVLEPVIHNSMRLMFQVSKLSPGSLIVAGGQGAAFDPNASLLLKNTPGKIVIRGWGEYNMLDALTGFENGRLSDERISRLRAVYYKDRAGAVAESPLWEKGIRKEDLRLFSLVWDPSLTPYQDYWAFIKGFYSEEMAKRMGTVGLDRTVRIYTETHCPMGCIFCSSTRLLADAVKGHKQPALLLSASDIFKIIKQVKQAHPDVGAIYFNDDNFFLKKDRVRDLADMLIKTKLAEKINGEKINFFALSRVDNVDADLLALVKRAGFSMLIFGVENFSDRILKDMKKRVRTLTKEQTQSEVAYQSVTETMKAGLKARMNLILFYPTTNLDDLQVTIDKSTELISQGAIVDPFEFVEPYAGSTIRKEAEFDWESETVQIPSDVGEKNIKLPSRILPVDKTAREIGLELVGTKRAVSAEFLKKFQREFNWKEDKLPAPVVALIVFYIIYKAAQKFDSSGRFDTANIEKAMDKIMRQESDAVENADVQKRSEVRQGDPDLEGANAVVSENQRMKKRYDEIFSGALAAQDFTLKSLNGDPNRFREEKPLPGLTSALLMFLAKQKDIGPLLRKIQAFKKELKDSLKLMPGEILWTPQENLHATIANPDSKIVPELSTATFDGATIEKVRQMVAPFAPFEIRWQGVTMGSNGDIILQGFMETRDMIRLREAFLKVFPLSEFPNVRIPNVVYSTLGRFRTPLGADRYRALLEKIGVRRDFYFGSMNAENLSYIRTALKEGQSFGEEAYKIFEEFQLSSSPRSEMRIFREIVIKTIEGAGYAFTERCLEASSQGFEALSIPDREIFIKQFQSISPESFSEAWYYVLKPLFESQKFWKISPGIREDIFNVVNYFAGKIFWDDLQNLGRILSWYFPDLSDSERKRAFEILKDIVDWKAKLTAISWSTTSGPYVIFNILRVMLGNSHFWGLADSEQNRFISALKEIPARVSGRGVEPAYHVLYDLAAAEGFWKLSNGQREDLTRRYLSIAQAIPLNVKSADVSTSFYRLGDLFESEYFWRFSDSEREWILDSYVPMLKNIGEIEKYKRDDKGMVFYALTVLAKKEGFWRLSLEEWKELLGLVDHIYFEIVTAWESGGAPNDTDIVHETKGIETAYADINTVINSDRFRGLGESERKKAFQELIRFAKTSNGYGILQHFEARSEVRNAASSEKAGTTPREISGYLFDPGYVISDRDEVKHEPKKAKKRTSQEVREILRKAKEAGKPLEIVAHLRAVDGPGSSLDLPEFQKMLTPQEAHMLYEIPATVAIASNFTVKIRFEPAADPDAIEYVAPQYGITEDHPYVVKGKVNLTQAGRAPRGQVDGPAFIFSNTFGITGVRVICERISPMAIAGGMESSNAFNGALFAAASMLSGADWSFGDIFSAATAAENDTFGGLTGGQGTLVAFLGGAYHYLWLLGMKDSQGEFINPHGAFAMKVLEGSDFDFLEERMALAQAGKTYENGKSIGGRTAALINYMWTDLLREDPAGFEMHSRKPALTEQYISGLKNHDMAAVVDAADRYVDIRDALCRRWAKAVLYEGKRAWLERMEPRDKAAIAIYGAKASQIKEINDLLKELTQKQEALGAMTDQSGKESERAALKAAFKSLRAKLEALALKNLEVLDQKNTSLYSDTSKDLIAAARKEGIAVMPTGAGGPGANLIVIAPNGKKQLEDFLHSQNLPQLTDAGVEEVMNGTGLLRGYMPLKIGKAPMKFIGFKEAGLTAPAAPVNAVYNEKTAQFRTVTEENVIDSLVAELVKNKYPENESRTIIAEHLRRLRQRESVDLVNDKDNKWKDRLRYAVQWLLEERGLMEYDYRLSNLFGAGLQKDVEVKKAADRFVKLMRKEKARGVVFFIDSGGSGAGKSTMWTRIMKDHPGQFRKFLMYTTRERRLDADFKEGITLSKDGDLYRALHTILLWPLGDLGLANHKHIPRFLRPLLELLLWGLLYLNGVPITKEQRGKIRQILDLSQFGENGKRYMLDPKRSPEDPIGMEIPLSERIEDKNGVIRVYGEFEGVDYYYTDVKRLDEIARSEKSFQKVMMGGLPQGYSIEDMRRAIEDTKAPLTVFEVMPYVARDLRSEFGKKIVTFFISPFQEQEQRSEQRSFAEYERAIKDHEAAQRDALKLGYTREMVDRGPLVGSSKADVRWKDRYGISALLWQKGPERESLMKKIQALFQESLREKSDPAASDAILGKLVFLEPSSTHVTLTGFPTQDVPLDAGVREAQYHSLREGIEPLRNHKQPLRFSIREGTWMYNSLVVPVFSNDESLPVVQQAFQSMKDKAQERGLKLVRPEFLGHVTFACPFMPLSEQEVATINNALVRLSERLREDPSEFSAASAEIYGFDDASATDANDLIRYGYHDLVIEMKDRNDARSETRVDLEKYDWFRPLAESDKEQIRPRIGAMGEMPYYDLDSVLKGYGFGRFTDQGVRLRALDLIQENLQEIFRYAEDGYHWLAFHAFLGVLFHGLEQVKDQAERLRVLEIVREIPRLAENASHLVINSFETFLQGKGFGLITDQVEQQRELDKFVAIIREISRYPNIIRGRGSVFIAFGRVLGAYLYEYGAIEALLPQPGWDGSGTGLSRVTDPSERMRVMEIAEAIPQIAKEKSEWAFNAFKELLDGPGYSDIAGLEERMRVLDKFLVKVVAGHRSEGEVDKESRSEVRTYETPVVPQVSAVDTSNLEAKIGTAIRVAANTVSPLLSVSPAYASEVAPELFGGTIHFQQAAVVPPIFAAKWPVFNKIISRFASASTERMVIDQRQGVPDAASVQPLVTFALYNPKAAVVLALVVKDHSPSPGLSRGERDGVRGFVSVGAFVKKLVALSQNGALPQNFKVQAFASENEFVGAFAGFYNSAAPFGRSVALITDREDSVVTRKIGSRRHLLSVVGAQNPLKQTASTLLAADKLLNESIWSMGYHFVSVDKLGGLEALMAELTSYVAAQAKVLASA